ncbi:hypothetical protein [Plesiomonas shigelloides]|uniref:hypothetical protein n=1 Tax=Plesiomonas shigelloides TaxID=703 RepID=UPI001C5AC6A8|nr:hypothetical protein [Plesiomonas shigelloides]MBW3792206.1 hypothetical protein [Plesiomonas shigelloides]
MVQQGALGVTRQRRPAPAGIVSTGGLGHQAPPFYREGKGVLCDPKDDIHGQGEDHAADPVDA